VAYTETIEVDVANGMAGYESGVGVSATWTDGNVSATVLAESDDSSASALSDAISTARSGLNDFLSALKASGSPDSIPDGYSEELSGYYGPSQLLGRKSVTVSWTKGSTSLSSEGSVDDYSGVADFVNTLRAQIALVVSGIPEE